MRWDFDLFFLLLYQDALSVSYGPKTQQLQLWKHDFLRWLFSTFVWPVLE